MLEPARPLMQRPHRRRVHSVKHLPPRPTRINQAHFFQHSEMLRNRGLFQLQGIYDLAYGFFLHRQIIQDLSPPNLRHSVKRIRCSRRSCHFLNIFLYRNICQARLRADVAQALLPVQAAPTARLWPSNSPSKQALFDVLPTLLAFSNPAPNKKEKKCQPFPQTIHHAT
jgi:hypothetical protein